MITSTPHYICFTYSTLFQITTTQKASASKQTSKPMMTYQVSTKCIHTTMFMRRNNNTSTFFKAFFFFSSSSYYYYYEGAWTLCHVFEESSSHDMLSTRQYYGVVMMMKVCFKQGRCEWCRLLPTKASPRGCVHFISELNGRVDGCTGDCTEDRGDQVNPYAVVVAGSNSRPQRPYRVHGSTSARPDHIYHQVQILKFLF